MCAPGCVQHGRVVETGSHQKLLDKGGAYAAMWSRQVEASRSTVDMASLTDDAGQPQKPATATHAKAARPPAQGGEDHHYSQAHGHGFH